MLHKKHATCVLHKMFEWRKVYCSCKPNFEIKWRLPWRWNICIQLELLSL